MGHPFYKVIVKVGPSNLRAVFRIILTICSSPCSIVENSLKHTGPMPL